MNRDEALLLVDGLYAAALGEFAWPDALTRVADAMRATGATLELHDVDKGVLLAFDSARLDPDSVPIYVRDYAWRNPRTFFLRRTNVAVTFDHLFLTEEEMDREAFYAEFLPRYGLRYFVAVQTPLIDGRIKGVLAIQRSGRVRGVATETVETMGLLSSSVERSIRLYWIRIRNEIDTGHLDCALARLGLTLAERRLAASIACGDTLRGYAIAQQLSMNTVYTHYARIKHKLECNRQTQLLLRLRAF